MNSVPYMFVDSASGQSFAQAYDAVANALRAGQTAPNAPFFENQFPGLAKAEGSTATSSTAFIVGANKSNIVSGNVGQLFLTLDAYRAKLGLTPYDSDQAQMEFLRTYIGYSNYNAGIITVNKRLSHGLSLTANYTYSIALDDGLSNQNNAGFYSVSSAELVGRFGFRESSQVVIEGHFHGIEGAKAVGSSGNHSDFVVETLNSAI